MLDAVKLNLISSETLRSGRLRVLIQGDGSRFTANRGCFMIAVKLLDIDTKVIHQVANLHPVMLLDGHEVYECLQLAMSQFWDSVEALTGEGFELEPGHRIRCKFSLSGDLKFIWTVLGFSTSAASDFRCLFCPIHKNHFGCVLETERHKCNVHQHTQQPDMCSMTRNLADIIQLFSDDRKSRQAPLVPCDLSTEDKRALAVQVQLRKVCECRSATMTTVPCIMCVAGFGQAEERTAAAAIRSCRA